MSDTTSPGWRGDATPAFASGSTRTALGDNFIKVLRADFEAMGADAIAQLRAKNPAVYLRFVAMFVRENATALATNLDDLSDEQLAACLAAVDEALRVQTEIGRSRGAAEGGEPVAELSAVSEAEDVS